MPNYRKPSITTDLNGNFKEQPKAKSTSKPKPYVEAEWLSDYRIERDICYWIVKGGECNWTDEQIKQVKEKYFK